MKPVVHDFMRASTYQEMSEAPQDLGVAQPPLELPLPGGTQLIPLPSPNSLSVPDISLRKAVEERRTVRKYQDTAISQEELSYLLWMTQGVKEITQRPATLRTVPSAGARHAFETYLLVNRVEGLEAGLYRFAASQHALVGLGQSEDVIGTFVQSQVKQSAATFIWVAVVERMAWRYVERGYRYLHLDAGHVCQNLYLAAEAVNCGVCAIGAFDDNAINQELGLDSQNQFVIYVAALGKKIVG